MPFRALAGTKIGEYCPRSYGISQENVVCFSAARIMELTAVLNESRGPLRGQRKADEPETEAVRTRESQGNRSDRREIYLHIADYMNAMKLGISAAASRSSFVNYDRAEKQGLHSI